MPYIIDLDDICLEVSDTVTTEKIYKIIDILKRIREKSYNLTDEEEEKYIFRASFIHLLAQFLLENNVKLRDEFYSPLRDECISLATVVDEIPDNYERYGYLLEDGKFIFICKIILQEIINANPTVKNITEQDDKSKKTLLELKRKL